MQTPRFFGFPTMREAIQHAHTSRQHARFIANDSRVLHDLIDGATHTETNTVLYSMHQSPMFSRLKRTPSFFIMIDRATGELICYQETRRLGQGAFSEAFLFENQQKKDPITVKKSHIAQSHWQPEDSVSCDEYEHSKQVYGPESVYFITAFRGADNTTEHTWRLLLPYQKGQELISMVKSLDENNVVQVILALVKQVQALHALGVIHGDLKVDNILVSMENAQCDITLIDYGLSSLQGQPATVFSTVLYRSYIAPERFFCKTHKVLAHASQDVFSLGFCLRRLLTALPLSCYVKVTKKHPSIDLFIKGAMKKDPNKRPTLHAFEEALSKELRCQTWYGFFSEKVTKCVSFLNETTYPLRESETASDLMQGRHRTYQHVSPL